MFSTSQIPLQRNIAQEKRKVALLLAGALLSASVLAGFKVEFWGFCGRYRLTWKDAEGKEISRFVEVKSKGDI